MGEGNVVPERKSLTTASCIMLFHTTGDATARRAAVQVRAVAAAKHLSQQVSASHIERKREHVLSQACLTHRLMSLASAEGGLSGWLLHWSAARKRLPEPRS